MVAAGRMGGAEGKDLCLRSRTGGGSATVRGLRAAVGCAGHRDADGDGTGGGGWVVDGKTFEKGRDLAAWLGLTSAEQSTGGRQRLGGISNRGNRCLRTLPVHCARLSLETLAKRADGLGIWLHSMLKSTDRRAVIVALAARLARIAWSLLTSGQSFTAQPRPAPAGREVESRVLIRLPSPIDGQTVCTRVSETCARQWPSEVETDLRTDARSPSWPGPSTVPLRGQLHWRRPAFIESRWVDNSGASHIPVRDPG